MYSCRRTKTVPLEAYLAHKGHGDVCGPCNYDEDEDGVREPHDIDPQDPDSDSDADGIMDRIETGGDGKYDEGEDTDPLNPDTDGDGIWDGQEDSNRNGTIDAGESDPLSFCSPVNTSLDCDYDNDGKANRNDFDDDGDGVADTNDADPFNPNSDSDLDGLSDLAEWGTSDPLNPCDPVVVDSICVGIDADGDGFFGNYAVGHEQYDPADDNECVPSTATTTTFVSSVPANRDTYLEQQKPTKNHGIETRLEVEIDGEDGRNVLMHFDVSEVNLDILQSAKVKLFVTSKQVDGVILEAHKVSKYWEEGTKKQDNGVPNWQYRKHNTSWSAVGGDYYPTVYGSQTVTDEGWVEIDLPKALIEYWITNPSENHGLLIKASTNSSYGLITFASREHTESSKRPLLALELSVGLCGEDGQSGTGVTGASIADTDGDGIYDHIEVGGDGVYHEGIDTDPNNADTDGDGMTDGEEDTNKDGGVNGNESDPRSACSPLAIGLHCDFDGDGWINLFDWDDDNDGVTDLYDADKYNPNSDTDNDDISDIEEKGTSDPRNACDPDGEAAACIGIDNDHDGFYANVPTNDPKFDADDNDACVPESGNGVCDGCTVNSAGRMVICHRPFGRNNKIKFNLEIFARDWASYKALGGKCGPCGDDDDDNDDNLNDDNLNDDEEEYEEYEESDSQGAQGGVDSDGDGLTDMEEIGADGVYHAGIDSDPFNPCDPSPENGECEGIDNDDDGYFSNYPTGHTQYDADDTKVCIPVNNGASTSTFTINEGKDTYLKESSKNRDENYGGKSDLHLVGNDNKNERGLIQFDLSAHAGKTVLSATMYMHMEKGENTDNIVEARKVLTAWTEGSKLGADGVSNWDNATATTAWQTPGGDFDATVVGTMPTSALGFQLMELSTELVQSWIDDAGSNNGLILMTSGGDTTKHVEFNTFDGPSATRPYLVLVLEDGCN